MRMTVNDKKISITCCVFLFGSNELIVTPSIFKLLSSLTFELYFIIHLIYFFKKIIYLVMI
jgi:hypothetical protein